MAILIGIGFTLNSCGTVGYDHVGFLYNRAALVGHRADNRAI